MVKIDGYVRVMVRVYDLIVKDEYMDVYHEIFPNGHGGGEVGDIIIDDADVDYDYTPKHGDLVCEDGDKHEWESYDEKGEPIIED